MEHKSTVLAANMNKGLITALTVILKKVFERIIFTQSKDELINQIKAQEEIDVIVLDISLPPSMGDKKDWIDIIRGIKSQNKEVQIITLTTFSDNSLALMSIKAGAFDFVPKPGLASFLISPSNSPNFNSTCAFRLFIFSNIAMISYFSLCKFTKKSG